MTVVSNLHFYVNYSHLNNNVTQRRCKAIDLFRLYILFFFFFFHVMILRRFDPLFCSLKRVHASMNMSACTLFNE